jgi:hypothetical protein
MPDLPSSNASLSSLKKFADECIALNDADSLLAATVRFAKLADAAQGTQAELDLLRRSFYCSRRLDGLEAGLQGDTEAAKRLAFDADDRFC